MELEMELEMGLEMGLEMELAMAHYTGCAPWRSRFRLGKSMKPNVVESCEAVSGSGKGRDVILDSLLQNSAMLRLGQPNFGRRLRRKGGPSRFASLPLRSSAGSDRLARAVGSRSWRQQTGCFAGRRQGLCTN